MLVKSERHKFDISVYCLFQGAAFIRGWRLLIFWLSGAAFIRGRRLIEGGVYSNKYGIACMISCVT